MALCAAQRQIVCVVWLFFVSRVALGGCRMTIWQVSRHCLDGKTATQAQSRKIKKKNISATQLFVAVLHLIDM